MTTHVWMCSESSYRQAFQIDKFNAQDPELEKLLMDKVEEYFVEKVPVKHVHVFEEVPSHVPGFMFHKCSVKVTE